MYVGLGPHFGRSLTADRKVLNAARALSGPEAAMQSTTALFHICQLTLQVFTNVKKEQLANISVFSQLPPFFLALRRVRVTYNGQYFVWRQRACSDGFRTSLAPNKVTSLNKCASYWVADETYGNA